MLLELDRMGPQQAAFSQVRSTFQRSGTPPTTISPRERPGLTSVPDPRDRRGVRHALPVILALTLAAVLAGARSFTAIGEWVTDPDHAFLVQLGATGSRLPSESTIRRVL